MFVAVVKSRSLFPHLTIFYFFICGDRLLWTNWSKVGLCDNFEHFIWRCCWLVKYLAELIVWINQNWVKNCASIKHCNHLFGLFFRLILAHLLILWIFHVELSVLNYICIEVGFIVGRVDFVKIRGYLLSSACKFKWAILKFWSGNKGKGLASLPVKGLPKLTVYIKPSQAAACNKYRWFSFGFELLISWNWTTQKHFLIFVPAFQKYPEMQWLESVLKSTETKISRR